MFEHRLCISDRCFDRDSPHCEKCGMAWPCPAFRIDYTPPEGDIALGYAERAERVCGTGHFAAMAEFDRWLAEVKAEAWDEGEVAAREEEYGFAVASNPYREETNND